MRTSLGFVLCIVAALAATSLAGAARPADAAPTGTERAQHCTFPTTLITFVAAGSGSVSPPSGSRPCGTVVQITATPAQNFRFVGWVGFCGGTANPCSLFLGESSDHFSYQVGARFERIRQTVTVQKSGNGTVRSDPGGIDCGNTCQGTSTRAARWRSTRSRPREASSTAGAGHAHLRSGTRGA